MDVQLDAAEARRLEQDPEFRAELEAMAEEEPVYIYGPGGSFLHHVPNRSERRRLPLVRGAMAPPVPGARSREGIHPVGEARRAEMLPRDAEGNVVDLERTKKTPSAWMSIQPHILYLREQAFELGRQLLFDSSGRPTYRWDLVKDDVAFEPGIERVGRMKPTPVWRVVLRDPVVREHTYELSRRSYVAMGLSETQIAEKTRGLLRGELPVARAFNMLSKTGKMNCYSFNLPAGPREHGGACPSSKLGWMFLPEEARLKAQRGTGLEGQIDVRSFVCNGCYALKGSYGNPSTVIVMAMRFMVIEQWLDEGRRRFGRERGEQVFATRMIDAIQAQRELSRRVRASVLPKWWWSTAHPDFFRIHDSGDFYRPDYYRGWLSICRHLPDVHFWAPNRTYATTTKFTVGEGAEGETFDVRDIPKNLALRPSALHFGAAAAAVPGLSAGSGATSEDIRAFPEHKKWECPALLGPGPPHFGGAVVSVARLKQAGRELDRPGKLTQGKCARAHGPNSPARGGNDPAHSPEGHGCRVCWIDKERYVYYHEH
jgi:hypothetical protein